jgi:hypothetical protein
MKLEASQSLWTDSPVTEKTLRNDFARIGLLFNNQGFMDPMLRFAHGMSALPGVTGMLDGMVVKCRDLERGYKDDDDSKKVDRTFSGKHRIHCYKFEVFVSLLGVPLFFRGPVRGSVHDAALFKKNCVGSRPLFHHHKEEMWLGDLGYIGCEHCLVPYKKSSKSKGLDDTQKSYNDRHGLVRSRVERFFKCMREYRVFQETEHHPQFLKDCAALVLNIMYLTTANAPHYNDCEGNINDGLHREIRTKGSPGICWCSGGCGVMKSVRQGTLHAEITAMDYNPKKPAKRPKLPDE